MQTPPGLSEGVFRFRRHHGIDFPVNETRSFELPEHLNQHLLGNIGDMVLKFIEAPHAAREAVKNDGRPFVADQLQDATRRIARVKDVGGLVLGYHPSPFSGLRPAIAQGNAVLMEFVSVPELRGLKR
jgi:hypothetical protein